LGALDFADTVTVEKISLRHVSESGERRRVPQVRGGNLGLGVVVSCLRFPMPAGLSAITVGVICTSLPSAAIGVCRF
jgi:hypothetical protein